MVYLLEFVWKSLQLPLVWMTERYSVELIPMVARPNPIGGNFFSESLWCQYFTQLSTLSDFRKTRVFCNSNALCKIMPGKWNYTNSVRTGLSSLLPQVNAPFSTLIAFSATRILVLNKMRMFEESGTPWNNTSSPLRSKPVSCQILSNGGNFDNCHGAGVCVISSWFIDNPQSQFLWLWNVQEKIIDWC